MQPEDYLGACHLLGRNVETVFQILPERIGEPREVDFLVFRSLCCGSLYLLYLLHCLLVGQLLLDEAYARYDGLVAAQSQVEIVAGGSAEQCQDAEPEQRAPLAPHIWVVQNVALGAHLGRAERVYSLLGDGQGYAVGEVVLTGHLHLELWQIVFLAVPCREGVAAPCHSHAVGLGGAVVRHLHHFQSLHHLLLALV